MSVLVSNKKFVGKASISPDIYDIDDILVYGYLPEEPGRYYRKLAWESNELTYRTQQDSYVVYKNGAWTDERYKTIVFGPNMMLTDEDYAWLTSWADYVGEDQLYTAQKSSLTLVADMIRYKGSTVAPVNFPEEFVDAIEDIPTGASYYTYDPYNDLNEYCNKSTLTAPFAFNIGSVRVAKGDTYYFRYGDGYSFYVNGVNKGKLANLSWPSRYIFYAVESYFDSEPSGGSSVRVNMTLIS